MFLTFFLKLKAAGVPVTLREHLALLDAMRADLVTYDVEGFYYLARATLVKDERFIGRF
ncbi:MAG: VWA domain-containing protein, partial [Aurantimonas coralicida]